MAQELGLKDRIAMYYVSLSFNEQEFSTAAEMFEKALAELRPSENRHLLAVALFLYADRARTQGDFERAERYYQESLAIARTDQNRWAMASPLGNLGRLAVHRGDYERGAALVREAVDIGRQMELSAGVANYLIYLGTLATYLGDYDSAERDLTETLSIWRELGNVMGVTHALYCLAELALHREEFDQASQLLVESLNLTLSMFDWSRNFSVHEFNMDRLFIGGKLLCAVGRYEQGVRALATGEILRRQFSFVLEPLPHAEAQQSLEMARNQLGNEVFAAVWEAVQSLTESEAVTLLVEYLQRNFSTVK